MTKSKFKDLTKNGKVFTYGYCTKTAYDSIKEKNIKLNHNIEPLKMTSLSHIGSDWKNIIIELYDGFIVLLFDTSSVAFYKVES